MTPDQGLAAGVAFVVGAVVGSYAVTTGLRWARSEGSSRGRSHCDVCASTLSYWQTVPIVSFVAHRGACATCHAKIDPTHLIGELAGGVVLSSLILFDPSVRGLALAALGFLLILASAVDAKIQRLPDITTFAIGGLGAIAAAITGLEHLMVGACAAAIALIILLGVRRWSSRRTAGPGLGLGDVKLVAALSLWVGVATPWMVVLAAIIGLVAVPIIRPANGRLAFGPALALAGWVVGLANQSGALPWLG